MHLKSQRGAQPAVRGESWGENVVGGRDNLVAFVMFTAAAVVVVPSASRLPLP